MVDEAAEGHLVEAIPNPAHQRSSLIRLTDPGRTAIDELIARESALMRRPSPARTAPRPEVVLTLD